MKTPRPAVAVSLLALVAVAKILLYLPFLDQYGWFRDELYYFASTEHLDWGYVDHPPLSIALLAIVRLVAGDSLALLRLPAVLAGAATIFLVGLIAREMGGGRFAQATAAIAALAAPVWLGIHRYYSMNAIDLLIWAVAGLLFARLLAREVPSPKGWAVLGVVLGLGLLNKLSVLYLGVGLLFGLLATPRRRDLVTRGPWLAAAIAFLCATPYLFWQVRHGWPTLEFMRNAAASKNVAFDPLTLLASSALEMNPLSAPLWVLGLAWGIFGRGGATARALAVAWAAVFAVLAASGSAKPYYLAGSFAFLLPIGAVALERFTERGSSMRWLRIAAPALLAASGLVLAPFAIPVLPPDTLVAYMKASGVSPPASERHAQGSLPQHYADMFGWPELAAAVSKVYESLPSEEKARCAIFGQNYGEAGAIDVLGRRLGLPPAISGHNSYGIWGPGQADGSVVIVIGGDEDDNRDVCGSLTRAGTFTCDRCMPYENDLPLFVCRDIKVPLAELWPRLRHFD